MSVGYYIDADANGNLGFFLASNNTELMYISDTGNLWVSGQVGFGDSLGLTSSEIGFFPYSSGTVLGQDMSFLTLWGTVDTVGVWMGENYGSLQIGLFNRTSSTYGVLSGNSWMMNLGINDSGEVYTFVPTNYAIGVANSVNSGIGNILDDGSKNMSVGGSLTVSGEISGGSYNLVGGTGISFSGTTITNTGVTSITAGTNITISGSTGDVTIDASGGGTTYTAGNGITISGTTIEMSGSYSGTFSASSGFGIPFASNSGGESLYLGSSAWGGSLPSGSSATGISGFSFTGGSGSQVFTFSSASGQTAINTDGSFFAGDGGFTYNPFGTNYATDGDILANGNIAGGGSLGINGNASISGSLTAQYINANVNSDNPNGTTPTVVLSIWGGGQGNAVSSSTTYYGIGISDSTLDFLTNGGFAWWYNDTEVASMNGSGDLSLNGNLSLSGTATGGFALNFNSTTLRPSSLPFTYSVTVPAGTWAGYVQLGMFFTPSSGITYSYEASINMSGAALVSSFSSGTCALTDISGGTGSNYPLVNFPIIPISLESSGGTITFSINNTSQINGMTSILAGASDSAFRVNVFLVSTSTAS